MIHHKDMMIMMMLVWSIAYMIWHLIGIEMGFQNLGYRDHFDVRFKFVIFFSIYKFKNVGY